jgi:hypothetical protein
LGGSANTKLSFTAAEDSPLMPNGAAYLNDDLVVRPEPIIKECPAPLLCVPISQSITVGARWAICNLASVKSLALSKKSWLSDSAQQRNSMPGRRRSPAAVHSS